MIQPISQNDMVAMMLALRGATFVTFVAVTEPVFAKYNEAGEPSPFRTGDIIKTANVNGTINFIYQNSVNLQRKREDLETDFQAMPRQWGHRIWQGNYVTPVIEHTNKAGEHKFYIEVKPERSLSHVYHDRNGNLIPAEQVEPFIRKNGRSRQGVQKEVYCRDYKVSDIRSLTMKGQDYVIAEAA